jgi:hypothetical protein
MKLRRKISVRPSTRHCSCANTIMIDVGGVVLPIQSVRIELRYSLAVMAEAYVKAFGTGRENKLFGP